MQGSGGVEGRVIMVGEWLANGWQMFCQWLANGWRMVGHGLQMAEQWVANGWPMVCRMLANGWPTAGQWLAPPTTHAYTHRM